MTARNLLDRREIERSTSAAGTIGTLRGEGIGQARIVDALTVAWRERVAVTVPAELRRIGAESE